MVQTYFAPSLARCSGRLYMWGVQDETAPTSVVGAGKELQGGAAWRHVFFFFLRGGSGVGCFARVRVTCLFLCLVSVCLCVCMCVFVCLFVVVCSCWYLVEAVAFKDSCKALLAYFDLSAFSLSWSFKSGSRGFKRQQSSCNCNLWLQLPTV